MSWILGRIYLDIYRSTANGWLMEISVRAIYSFAHDYATTHITSAFKAAAVTLRKRALSSRTPG